MSYEQEPPTDMDIWNDLQRQIDQLKSENKRLTKALQKIIRIYINTFDTKAAALEMAKAAGVALMYEGEEE